MYVCQLHVRLITLTIIYFIFRVIYLQQKDLTSNGPVTSITNVLMFQKIFLFFTTNPIDRSSSLHIHIHIYSAQQQAHID